jgi:hypothetical protein
MNALRSGAFGILGGLSKNKYKNFLLGTPEVRENVSTLRPEQEGLYRNAVNAGLSPGAGGSFGTSADYYRDLLSDNPADLESMVAPELRRFNQQTIPGLAEQFAGMGAGGLDSSGFRNASINAGTDLAERIASIRAGLRERGAAGLANIGQIGLQPYSQNMVTQQGTQGALPALSGIAGTVLGSFAGPAGAAIGNQAGNWLGNWATKSLGGNKAQQAQPYGNQMPNASTGPSYQGQYGNEILNNYNPGRLPSFGGR